MNRLLVVVALVGLVCSLWSCQKSAIAQKEHPEMAALYYCHLMEQGDYDGWIDGMASCDSASEDYRKVMIASIKQQVVESREKYGTIKNIDFLRSEHVINEETSNVYIKITYEKQGTEITVLPLVWTGKKWRML